VNPPDANTPITLALTLAEVNAVLQLVANGPFAQVHELIAKIRQQAEAQLAPKEAAPTE